MQAKKGNIVNTKRVRLEEVIPLKTPFSICIDPSYKCNFRCNFCAIQKSNDEVSFDKEIMPFDLYRKIINDLKDFDEKLKILRLNGQGEPLLNRRFPEMVSYAKERDVADYIETITNGSCFNADLNQRLVDSGIDRIRISVEATDARGYFDNANIKINFERYVENIRDLYDRSRGRCEIYIKTVDAAVSTDEMREKFYSIFGDICDKIFVDKVIPLWSDFEELNSFYSIEKDSGVHGQEIKDILICPYPFYSCIINPNGDVTACCADWKRKLIFGNAGLESLVDIWHGQKMRKFWTDLAAGKKNEYEMCRKCVLPSFDCNDDIDEYGDLILKHLM
ncbi:MAG: SPASM domain-containing protein [Lachnospiraceae bacterium]|nr:SPASM domain-containing protein [Lachnospiraceae bacterium]